MTITFDFRFLLLLFAAFFPVHFARNKTSEWKTRCVNVIRTFNCFAIVVRFTLKSFISFAWVCFVVFYTLLVSRTNWRVRFILSSSFVIFRFRMAFFWRCQLNFGWAELSLALNDCARQIGGRKSGERKAEYRFTEIRSPKRLMI